MNDIQSVTTDTRRGSPRSAQGADQRVISDAYAAYLPPEGDHRVVQLVRPFAVMSRNTYSSPVTLPIGLAYLAAVLEKASYSVKILDGVGEDICRFTPSPCGYYNLQGLLLDEIVRRIDPAATVIGISMMFSQEWLMHRELVRAVRKAFPGALIVAGGEHVTALPEYVLRDCRDIDIAVLGEGELTFLELVSNYFHGRATDMVPGTAFIDQDGQYRTTGLSRRIAHIEQLPPPAWHLCPVTNYFIDNWTMGISMGRNMPILGTRGCPYQCSFCSNPTMWTTRYQMRPVNDVVDEIEDLGVRFNANSIDFFDLTAIVKREWILSFCNELERRNLKVTWQLPSGTRSEALDEEVLLALKRTGCRFLVYAPESGSQETLDTIRKKITLTKITESIKAAVKARHVVKINLIIGFPHERFKHIWQTFSYAVRMAFIGVEDCNIAIFSPYPGSQLFRELLEAGTIVRIDDDYFRGLVAQFDMTSSANFCPNVPAPVLISTRILGQALFYGLSYLVHPGRIWRVVKGLVTGTFSPYNLFEQRIFDMFARNRLLREGGK